MKTPFKLRVLSRCCYALASLTEWLARQNDIPTYHADSDFGNMVMLSKSEPVERECTGFLNGTGVYALKQKGGFWFRREFGKWIVVGR
jgi:hypothetical protein